jgi:hypothetical protein
MYAARGGGAYRRAMCDPIEAAVAVHCSTEQSAAAGGVMLESAESAHSSHGVAADVRTALGISR